MILKIIFGKSSKPTCPPKTATGNKSTATCGMNLKDVTKKKTSPQQPKNAEAYEFCPSPQQQKT